jgi:acetyltransferase-like isoleucine patch superfamily enzyme
VLKRINNFIARKLYFLINKNKFKLLSSSSTVKQLLRVDGKENISIHDNVVIQKGTWLAAVPLTEASLCHLSIGEGTIIGHLNHIFATGEIYIGRNVLTADKVFISDNQHEFSDVNTPILSQGIKQLSKVVIGDGSWIGENVCVIGASIGKNSVIGANSVVTKDIPDFCVAVGSPARIIKRYDFTTRSWISQKK